MTNDKYLSFSLELLHNVCKRSGRIDHPRDVSPREDPVPALGQLLSRELLSRGHQHRDLTTNQRPLQAFSGQSEARVYLILGFAAGEDFRCGSHHLRLGEVMLRIYTKRDGEVRGT